MTLTSFRQTVAATLSSALSIAFVDGRIGPQQERDLGGTWPVSKAELEDNADVEVITVGVAIYKQHTQHVEPSLPFDPATLETLAEQAQQALDNVQTTAGPWYFRVTRIEFDTQGQGIELEVRGYQYNLFASS